MTRPITALITIILMAGVVGLICFGAYLLADSIGKSLGDWADRITCALAQTQTEKQTEFCDMVFERALQ